jgi:hypothetical protein
MAHELLDQGADHNALGTFVTPLIAASGTRESGLVTVDNAARID